MTTEITFDDNQSFEVTTVEDVMEQLSSNHMWVNAFACINPNDELAKQIGYWVLEKLNDRTCAIPAPIKREDVEQLSPEGRKALMGLNKLTPQVYLRFNKS